MLSFALLNCQGQVKKVVIASLVEMRTHKDSQSNSSIVTATSARDNNMTNNMDIIWLLTNHANIAEQHFILSSLHTEFFIRNSKKWKEKKSFYENSCKTFVDLYIVKRQA